MGGESWEERHGRRDMGGDSWEVSKWSLGRGVMRDVCCHFQWRFYLIENCGML